MTPKEAMKPSNQLSVKLNLELKRKHSRKYPEINVGDQVKLFKKKTLMDKERVSNWTKETYIVESIHESMGQKFYKLENRPKQLMRSEILLIN